MTQWLHREPAADQFQRVETSTIHSVVSDDHAPLLTTRFGSGDVELQDGVRSSIRSQAAPVVFVVDSDLSVRGSLERLLSDSGWRIETFESTRAFLCRDRVSTPNCLILDIRFLAADGLDLQRRLAVDRKDMPIIFVTDHGDVAITVQAMKAGASDFLTKPLSDAALLNAVRQAIHRSRAVLAHETQMSGLRDCYASLTRREREVMALVVAGLLNKQVGFELGISEITVKAHRGQVMRKMRANSLADLIKMATTLRD